MEVAKNKAGTMYIYVGRFICDYLLPSMTYAGIKQQLMINSIKKNQQISITQTNGRRKI